MRTVLLKGPILSKSGYGEHARFVYRSLKSRSDIFDVYVHPITWGQSAWIMDDTEETRDIKKGIEKLKGFQGTFDISLQVTIPNEWEKIAKYDVGITAGVESDKVSAPWLQKVNEMDKVIVVSEHAKQGFTSSNYHVMDNDGKPVSLLKAETDIDVVGYPWKNIEPTDLSEKINLTTEFNFLTISQWGPRKNIVNSIKWFVDEFLHNKEVGLVVKTHHANMSLIDRRKLKSGISNLLETYGDKRKCKIYFLHGSMSEEEIHGLYHHPKIKAYLTTTHGEGFGLPLFEAAYSGLPVIAPGWSGQMDFLRAPKENGKGKENLFTKVKYNLQPVQKEAVWKDVVDEDSKWAFAEEKSFKKEIRNSYEARRYGIKEKQAKRLKDWICEEFAADIQNEKMVRSILGEKEFENENIAINELPKISIITSVYDGDEYIEDFLEDITRQTIFTEKCELILVNPNSPGNEEEVINKYLEKFPDNIVYHKLDKDPGIYGTWNKAIELSSGEFITNANLDDRKSLNSLEIHARTLFGNSDVDLVYSDMLVTDKPNETWEENSSEGRRYNTPEFSFETLKMINMPHASPMWRRNMHDNYGYFDEKYRSAGDWELWLRSASKGSKFKKINQVMNLYYFNPTGISTNPDNFDWKREEELEVRNRYNDIAVEEDNK